MRGSEYGVVSTRREHDKTRAHNGSELPSSRLAALACYAVAGRFAPGFASSLATPSQAPLYVGLRCVASLRCSGLNFLFFTLPGVARLLRSTTGLLYGAPPTSDFSLSANCGINSKL